MVDAEEDAANTSGASLDSVVQKEKDQTTKDSNKPGTSGKKYAASLNWQIIVCNQFDDFKIRLNILKNHTKISRTDGFCLT